MSTLDLVAAVVVGLYVSVALAFMVGDLFAVCRRPYERDAAECGPDDLRHPGTYHDPAVRTVPPRADLHVVRPPVIGLDAGQRHAGGLSLPVQARLDRASAAYALRRAEANRRPVKPFGIGDDTV